MIHEAIFPATCNATKVALQVPKNVSRVTAHFCNMHCKKMLRCELQEKLWTRVWHPLCNLQGKLPRVTWPLERNVFFENAKLRAAYVFSSPSIKSKNVHKSISTSLTLVLLRWPDLFPVLFRCTCCDLWLNIILSLRGFYDSNQKNARAVA